MPKLRSMLDVDMRGKLVLIRMDHNVVKKGKIKDPMRIDATIPTLLHIYKKGGLPIIMTHVGRPFDKKTGQFTISDDDSTVPVMKYLEQKLGLVGIAPQYPEKAPIVNTSPIRQAILELKAGTADFVYLPNTRWFRGEEAKDDSANAMALSLASLADVFVNDAFGSWQAHTSTTGIAAHLPSYAGLLMQKEIGFLENVFEPTRPMIAVVAGAKFDTKIGPLSSLIKLADKLVLGGVIYNAYLCVKYGISIKGVSPEDLEQAKIFIENTKEYQDRILELPYIVESASIESAEQWKMHQVNKLEPGTSLEYVLDAAPECFEEGNLQAEFMGAKTIFVNAVMGYTALFGGGTKALYQLIDKNHDALKLFGGGDTIQDFKDLLPGVFARAANDPKYYFFTGGGAILDAIKQGSPFGMKPVQALLD